ncbi:unnamed protein product [Adineta steineri]|uniref:Purinergic receptor n=1 Tax=Adineta steineri TaxID=433720 RepID=A0A819ETZ7_9BILA|nr:unnamed protein product [Adineta steineri]CAF3566473.1 unnamed protein product [Adineta steineri]CAF3857245.1 unnamed protein product [Adineta steineri]
MSAGSASSLGRCLSVREYFSLTNMKSMFQGFVYEYETPKIVTIHSISIALTCRIIQLLILIYGIVYLMIIKKGYQDIDTSIISSITLKVKGIGYNQTAKNKTLVIDGADYIVPPQENNALFLMTNFIRTDQNHSKCAEAPEIFAHCTNDTRCRESTDSHKANGKWTGKCLPNSHQSSGSQEKIGLCELEGWCPVENDRGIPEPIQDALNFTIFVKNFIEFPRFKVIRKNIQRDAKYLRNCSYDHKHHTECPIFRVGTILDLVEKDEAEQINILRLGGVIRIKIDWICNLDISLDKCVPVYSFGRLDAPSKEENFSVGFNFRFASHWKHENQSFRTLTKAFGLRFIISVSGHAGRFDVIQLSLNIGSLIGILGLATFICDIVALYVHRQSSVYRQQKFQDVDLNLLRLETLNSLAEGMVSEVTKRKNQNHLDQRESISNVIENHDVTSITDSPLKEKFQRSRENPFYDNVSTSSTIHTNPALLSMTPSNNFHQRQTGTIKQSTGNSSSSPLSLKQRKLVSTRPSQLTYSSNITDDKYEFNDTMGMSYVDEDSPVIDAKKQSNEMKRNFNIKTNKPLMNGSEYSTQTSPRIETFL